MIFGLNTDLDLEDIWDSERKRREREEREKLKREREAEDLRAFMERMERERAEYSARSPPLVLDLPEPRIPHTHIPAALKMQYQGVRPSVRKKST